MKKLYLSICLILIVLFISSCNNGNPAIYKKNAMELFLDKGDSENALKEINKAIKLDHKDYSLYVLRALIYDSKGNYLEEISDLDMVIQLANADNKKATNAYFQRAISKLNLEEYYGALDDINFFIENADSTNGLEKSYIIKGSIFYSLEDFQNAESMYNLAISANNNKLKGIDIEALVGLSNISKSKKNSLKLLDRAIAIDENNALVYGARSVIFMELGRYNQAYEDLKKSIKLNPSDSRVNFLMGQYFEENGNNKDSAMIYYQQAIKLSPQSPRNETTYLILGALSYKDGNFMEALNFLESAERINPNNHEVLYYLSSIFNERNNNIAALKMINRAIEINPTAYLYYNLKGIILLDSRSYNEAQETFLKSIEINSKSPEAYYNLGRLYSELKNHKKSISFYDKAVNLNFFLEGTLVNRGLEKMKINNISDACLDFRRAFSLGRTDIKPLLDQYCQ